MAWLEYGIYFMMVWFIVSAFVIILSFDLIKLKIVTKLKKKKGWGIAVEIKDNQAFSIIPAKLNSKNTKIDDKNYDIKPQDILLCDTMGTFGVILSENLKTSINPKEDSMKALDSDSLSNLIKRATLAGQAEFFKIIEKVQKYIPFVLLIVVIYMVASIYLLIKIMQSGAVVL